VCGELPPVANLRNMVRWWLTVTERRL